MIRKATLHDLEALVALENRSFTTDRLSRRSFRHLLTKAHAVTLVDELEGRLAGYATLLFNMGTSLARLYSISMDSEWRCNGVAQRLVVASGGAGGRGLGPGQGAAAGPGAGWGVEPVPDDDLIDELGGEPDGDDFPAAPRPVEQSGILTRDELRAFQE